MNLRRYRLALATAALAVASIAPMPTMAQKDSTLPKVEVKGRQFKVYEVKKGDSLYGISNHFGWDLDLMRQFNPDAVAKLDKGMKIYYPMDETAPEAEVSASTIVPESGDIKHKVKKGETVYSIARRYNVSVDEIYAANPGSRNGIKADETLVISQSQPAAKSEDSSVVYYTIKHGDTLYAVAKKYDTTVEKILRMNPGVSDRNFKADSVIRLQPGSARENVVSETVAEERLSSFDNYKVEKGDTWQTIADKTGVDTQELIDANKGVSQLKKNEMIAVPVTNVVEVEKQTVTEDPRDASIDGRMELYEEVNNIVSDNTAARIKVAVVLCDPTSKKDTEFMRGLLLAVDKIKNDGYGLDLNVIDGRPSAGADYDFIARDSQLVIITNKKDLPEDLVTAANENGTEIINVFDVKGEAYEQNPSIVQVMVPSNYFNASASDFIARRFGNRTLLSVGTPDAEDAVFSALKEQWKGDVRSMTEEQFEEFEPGTAVDYLVYAHTQKKEDIGRVTQKASNMKKETFGLVSVVGRPSWIVYAEALADNLSDADTWIPSRFFYDENDYRTRDFVAGFKENYGHEPQKSFPTYAAMGYDTAMYFIPATAQTGGDFNESMMSSRSLQSDFDLKRVSNWGGFVNHISYMLHFVAPGVVEKTKLD